MLLIFNLCLLQHLVVVDEVSAHTHVHLQPHCRSLSVCVCVSLTSLNQHVTWRMMISLQTSGERCLITVHVKYISFTIMTLLFISKLNTNKYF